MSNIATPVRPLRVLLATAGSRGDVEPFLALAEALLRAEHDVLVCAPDDPDSDGIPEIASLGVNFAELARAIEGLSPMRAFRDHIQPAMATALDRVVTHALEWHPDVIVTHPKLLTVPIVAESLGVPYLTVELTPILTPTADFPAAGVLPRSFGSVINRMSYRLATLGERMFRGDLHAARARLGLRQDQRIRPAAGSLAAISPTLVPRPADWPTTTHLTGDWPRQHQQRRQLDPRLAHFLAAETPFLYAGFGSMVGGNASARATAIIDGARRAGLRVVLSTGWGGLEAPDPPLDHDVLALSSVPHDVVLPRAAVAMHHGGAGTVHAAVRAGTPSVLVPFLADQPFWAQRLQAAGLSGAPLHRDQLTGDHVAAAISDALGRTAAVQQAAQRMRTEDGPAAAVAIIAEVGSPPAAPSA